MTVKACPVVLHPEGAPLRHLVMEHPAAGLQLVKGAVGAGEDPARAALRELWEEAGVQAGAALPLGQSDEIQPGETWHFTLVRPAVPLRERWRHLSADDGGTRFGFSWMPIRARPAAMEARYHRALDWIEGALG